MPTTLLKAPTTTTTTIASPVLSANVLTSDVLASDVWLRLDNLLDVCDEIGAHTFSVIADTVTFVRRSPAGVRRWQGIVGERGIREL